MKKILVGYISERKDSGVNSYIKSFCENIRDQDVEIDFLSSDENVDISEIGKVNSKVFVIPRNRKIIQYFKTMYKITKENKYDVAYFNISETYNCIGIIAAKLFKVKQVVVHSHSSGIEKESKLKLFISRCINSICKPVLTICADKKLACSKKAAEWLYTQDVIETEDYEIIYNAVNYELFQYNEENRDCIREKLGIKDNFVVGHVGRFSYPKNHIYLLDVFKKVLEKRNDAVLICAGSGQDFESVCNYAKEIGISDNVKFLGTVNNVEQLMQGFDVFLLPSRFEGLPIVAVEAQFSGLPCILSSNIDEGVVVGDNTKLLPIGESNIEEWAENVVKIDKRENRLLESAENYKLDGQKRQACDIVNGRNLTRKNTMLLDMAVKILLCIHYLLNITCLFNGVTLMLPFVFIAMLGIGFFYIKNIKCISKDVMVRLLFGFLLSYGLTFILVTNYDIVSSAKVGIWLIVNLTFVFGYNHFKSQSQIIFEIDTVARVFVILCTLLNIFNMLLLVGNVTKFVTSYDGQILMFGIAPWGRFYGNHYDPNYASICYGCAIIIALYLLNKSKGRVSKILYGISICLQSVYIIFAQSRTVRVAFLIGIVTYTILTMIRMQKKVFCMKGMCTTLLVICIVMVVPDSTIKLYNQIKSYGIENTVNESTEVDEDEDEEEDEEIVIGRQDVESSDISNRRFDIWKSGLEITESNILYGIGFANIKPYAIENMPDTYIVSNDYKKFNAFHNMFVDVLVSQGIIGIGIVAAIAIFFAVQVIRKRKELFLEGKNADTVGMLFSCILMLLVSSLFLSEIFYVNNVCTYIFWLLLGYLYYFLKKAKKS